MISANTKSDLECSGSNSSQLGRSEVNAVASSCPRSTTTWKPGKGDYFCYISEVWTQGAQKAPRASLLGAMPVQHVGSHLTWLYMCYFRDCWGHKGFRFSWDSQLLSTAADTITTFSLCWYQPTWESTKGRQKGRS